MNFINLPRGRRLVPVPAASLKANLNACYHPEMDLTAAELPLAGNGSDLSLILILPGRQADFVAGGLGRLEDKINLGRCSVRCCNCCLQLRLYQKPVEVFKIRNPDLNENAERGRGNPTIWSEH